MMIDRRRFLHGSAAAVTAPALAISAPALAETPSFGRLYKVVYDDRFPASVAFASAARARGATLARHSGDVTDIWFNDFYHQWKENPVAIAGLTNHASWFLLDMMAADAGLRTVYRGHHAEAAAAGSPRHRLFGPHEIVARQSELVGADWPAAAARIVRETPAQVPLSPTRSTILAARDHAVEPQDLISWVIANPLKV